MRRKTKQATKEITKSIFHILAIGGIVTLAGLLSGGKHANSLFGKLGEYSVLHIRQTIRRLRLQGMIEYDASDEESPILLTSKGFTRVEYEEFLRVFSTKTRWDHFWRMVIFDIPERKKKRRSFQHALQSAGFYRLQRSVYITPFDVKDHVLRLAKVYHVSGDVLFITSPSLGPFEHQVRQHFFQRSHKKDIYDKTIADRQ